MKISVLGLGYVGLPLACAIAKLTSHEVVGFDKSERKISMIKEKLCPIDDVQCAADLKIVSLNCSANPEIINNSDIYIVCVPTPVLNDYTPDLTPIKSATQTIANYLQRGQSVIIESTINPGVCDEIVVPLLESLTTLKSGIDFDVAHCPERINPGDPVWNVYNIPRNIGSTSLKATKKLAAFYREFIDAEINEMPNLKTAEATKIIENTFRDINIAFVNELAKSFDVLGIDLIAVIKGASNKPFAFMPHFPSCGVGGHCIPVDPYYLIERAKQSGFDHKFLKLAREINNSMPEYAIDKLVDALNQLEKPIKNTSIGLLGLSYKANVGDLRESPSIKLRSILEDKKANLYIFDPFFPDMSNTNSLDEILEKSEAILIATDHTEFKEIKGEILKKHNVKIVVDGKNCLNKQDIISKEIIYHGIGY
ncbi:MAG: nucleotide sugar dehydrogenase [Candidatus Kapabacteria bacterium]|nr:nucleotide sugar dehydrogenase [Ignavibacteriota bacterium]MCW5883900.1 nucleotide sugar dehydrogenase [Candidatus Kapabacteria bacterium]